MQKTLLLALVCGLALSFTGCGLTDRLTEKAAQTVTEKALESATNSDVDLANNEITVNTNGDSFSMGEDLKLPDNFPSDVPVYSPAKVVTTSTTGTAGFYATLTSPDGFSAISDYYNAQLVAEGWTIDNTSSFNGGGQSTTYITTKENRTLDVGIYKYEDSSEVTITITTDTSAAN